MRNRLTRGISGICENVSFVHTRVSNALVKSHARANGNRHSSAKPSARSGAAAAGEGVAWISIFLFVESMGAISARPHAREREQLRRPGDRLLGQRRRFALALLRGLRFPKRYPFAPTSIGSGFSTIDRPLVAVRPIFFRDLSSRAGSRAATHTLFAREVR